MGATRSATSGGEPANPSVADLMQKLHLTANEVEVADFSDDESIGDNTVIEWALVGKVLSPTVLHENTIQSAMRPAWGNPVGLKIRSIDNLFITEFGCKVDMERALAGSPWMVGRYATNV